MVDLGDERHRAVAACAPPPVLAYLNALVTRDDAVVLADIDGAFLFVAIVAYGNGSARAGDTTSTRQTIIAPIAKPTRRPRVVIDALAARGKRCGTRSHEQPHAHSLKRSRQSFVGASSRVVDTVQAVLHGECLQDGSLSCVISAGIPSVLPQNEHRLRHTDTSSTITKQSKTIRVHRDLGW